MPRKQDRPGQQKPRSRRAGGAKGTGAAKAAAPPEPQPWQVLVAYAWNQTDKKYDDKIIQVDASGALKPSEPLTGEFRRIDRLIFYTLPPAVLTPESKPEPLLILDTVPSERSKLIFAKGGGGKATVTIEAKVRTVLTAEEVVDVKVVLEQGKPKDQPQYKEFSLFNKNILKTQGGGLKSLNKALEVTKERPEPGDPPEDKTGPLIINPPRPFDPLKLRLSIGLSLAADTANAPCDESGVDEDKEQVSQLRIFFAPLGALSGSAAGQTPFVINFAMNKQDGGKCQTPPSPTTSLETFRSVDPKLKVDSSLLRRKVWKLLQRPSINITVGPKPAPRGGQNLPASRWVLQVHGVPAKGVPEFWNENFAEPYYKALNIVQSGRPVSFLPSLDDIDDSRLAATRWAMAYSLSDDTDKDDLAGPEYVFGEEPDRLSIMGLSLQPAEPTDATPQPNLAGALKQLKDHSDDPVRVELFVRGDVERPSTEVGRTSEPTVTKAAEFEKFPGVLLRLPKAIENHDQQSVRMGALDLQFAGRQTIDIGPANQSRMLVTPQDEFFAVHVEADFAVARVGPGGQDDLPGEEFVPEAGEHLGASEKCLPSDAELQTRTPSLEESEALIERNFRRKNPLVIVRSFTQPTDKDKFLLHASEHAQKRGSQTIRLNLQNGSAAGGDVPKEQVIVLDRNPFLVALVEFVPFSKQSQSGGSSIANWTNAGLEGANWELHTGSAPFDLVLPPQAVGEEMEKSHTVLDGQAADFRFGRPARLQLEPSFFQQNFTEAPWNLRRILGFPGQRAPGAGIKHIRFELLYGLSCDVNYPFLRLAEISALIGAIPGRLPRDIRWPAKKDRALGIDQESCFREARLSWSMLYRRYLSRVAILEPWDTHRPESLTVSSGMICRIRKNGVEGVSAAAPAPGTDPNLLVPPADLENPVDELSGEHGLKGGVTWGFESRNVYTAVMTTPPAGISSSAAISEPYFSSLGMWGHLKSSFDLDRSTIYADASMGRTYYYKLERIGRIACWWNKAKHVIVYERTVIPSRQFGLGGQQSRLEGTAFVRKVKEYVEILEKTRSYPDGAGRRTQQEEEALRQQRGCVADCSFEEGAKFNVQSSWGTDVGDIGWKVPIWNPSATPADVYPRPVVKFGLHSNVEGQSVPVPRRCKEPQNVYFYTDTRKETGSDPDLWPAVKDIDFCDHPRPEPRRDFQDGKTVQTTPDDPPVHPGFTPCTFTLEPATVPTDLVAERAGQPLAAVLENITMMRAAPLDAIKADAAHASAAALRGLTDRLSDAYAEILGALPKEVEAQTADALARVRQRVADSFNKAGGKFRAFQKDLDGTIETLKQQTAQLEQNIRNRETQLVESLRNQVAELGARATKNYRDSIAEIIAKVPQPEQLRAAALDNITHQVRALQEGLMLLRASPGMLQKLVRRYAEAAERLVRDTRDEAARIKRLIDDPRFNDPLTPGDLNALRAEAARLIAAADELARAIRTAGQRRPEEWIPDPTLVIIRDFLGGVEAELEAKKRRLNADLQAASNLSKARAKAIIGGFDTWDEAKIRDLANKSEALLEKKVQELIGPWLAARERELRDLLPGAATVEEVRRQVQATADRLDAVLKKESAEAQGIFRQLEGTLTDILAQSENLKQLVLTEAAELEKRLNELKQNAVQDLFNQAADLRRRIEAQRDEFFRHANDYVDKNVRRLLPVVESVYAVADPAIRLVRAFGRPPEVPNLNFQRPAVAYFYKEASKVVDITPVLSRVSQASQALDALKPVGIDLPTEKLVERLIPPDLRNFKLSDILPDFAGLQLGSLFSGLRMPRIANDNVRITHGLDAQTGRAWVEAAVDIKTEEPATVFTFGPVSLRLPTAGFQASARFEAQLDQPPRRTVSGRIYGNWELVVAGMKIVIFKDTELRFDDGGGLHFGISPRNVELPGVLAFVSELLSSFAGPDTGFSVGLLPTGVKAQLILPVPDIQGGTSGISNLTLGMVLMVQFADPNFGDAFTISLSFQLARKEAPFTITVFILGGGGYVDLTTTYAPAKQRLASAIEVGITAGASLAIALGPIHGGVYVFFGVTARFAVDTRPASPRDRGLTFGALIIIGGEVSVLGIVSASITLLLEVLYSAGRLTGHGRISIKIEICWCFTLEVEEDVTYELAGGGGSQRKEVADAGARPQLASYRAEPGPALAVSDAPERRLPVAAFEDDYDRLALTYINMLI